MVDEALGREKNDVIWSYCGSDLIKNNKYLSRGGFEGSPVTVTIKLRCNVMLAPGHLWQVCGVVQCQCLQQMCSVVVQCHSACNRCVVVWCKAAVPVVGIW